MPAKKRGRPKKSSTATAIENKKRSNDIKNGKRQISSIVWFAVAVFLLFVVCIKGENLWLYLHNFMFGVFGFCAIFCLSLLAWWRCFTRLINFTVH